MVYHGKKLENYDIYMCFHSFGDGKTSVCIAFGKVLGFIFFILLNTLREGPRSNRILKNHSISRISQYGQYDNVPSLFHDRIHGNL